MNALHPDALVRDAEQLARRIAETAETYASTPFEEERDVLAARITQLVAELDATWLKARERRIGDVFGPMMEATK